MKKEDFIKLGFTEEQAIKATEASAEELKGYIPKSRFDEVNESKKQLETDVKTRDKQLEELKKVDAEGLKTKIEELQGENKANKDQYEKDLKRLRRDSIDNELLTAAKAKNNKAVKALLETIDDTLDDGAYKTLRSEQVKKLAEGEDNKFLFNTEDSSGGGNNFTGIKPGEGKDQNSGGESTTLAGALQAHYASNSNE